MNRIKKTFLLSLVCMMTASVNAQKITIDMLCDPAYEWCWTGSYALSGSMNITSRFNKETNSVIKQVTKKDGGDVVSTDSIQFILSDDASAKFDPSLVGKASEGLCVVTSASNMNIYKYTAEGLEIPSVFGKIVAVRKQRAK